MSEPSSARLLVQCIYSPIPCIAANTNSLQIIYCRGFSYPSRTASVRLNNSGMRFWDRKPSTAERQLCWDSVLMRIERTRFYTCDEARARLCCVNSFEWVRRFITSATLWKLERRVTAIAFKMSAFRWSEMPQCCVTADAWNGVILDVCVCVCIFKYVSIPKGSRAFFAFIRTLFCCVWT